MKLKVGDKVRIREDLEIGGEHCDVYVVEEMLKFAGKTVTIYEINDDGCFILKEDGQEWFWTKEMLEPANCKLIFRDNATILLKDGKRYVTKCQAGDTYDREKGLLLCLAKANGYTYNDICEMLNNAECQGKKPCKITLSEFWANKGKKEMAIYCKSEAESMELLTAFDRVGKKWCDGSSYIDFDKIESLLDECCYYNNNTWSFHKNNCEIYKFNEVDLSK